LVDVAGDDEDQEEGIEKSQSEDGGEDRRVGKGSAEK
jgi:hypothetical protein